MALLNMGNVLHRAGESMDATILYQVLLSRNDTIWMAYCALGDALVFIGNYTESINAYDNCQRLQQIDDENRIIAEKKSAAVRCHLKLQSSLEEQHDNLQKTITELKSYKRRLDNVRSIHESVLHAQASDDARQQSNLIYDYFTYSPVERKYHDNLVSFLIKI